MLEVERAQMKILANWADAIGQRSVRDYLRMAEHALKRQSELQDELFNKKPAADIEITGPKSCDTE